MFANLFFDIPQHPLPSEFSIYSYVMTIFGEFFVSVLGMFVISVLIYIIYILMFSINSHECTIVRGLCFYRIPI